MQANVQVAEVSLVRTRTVAACFLRFSCTPIPLSLFLPNFRHPLSLSSSLPLSKHILCAMCATVLYGNQLATCRILSKYFTAAFNPIWHNGGTRNRIKGAL